MLAFFLSSKYVSLFLPTDQGLRFLLPQLPRQLNSFNLALGFRLGLAVRNVGKWHIQAPYSATLPKPVQTHTVKWTCTNLILETWFYFLIALDLESCRVHSYTGCKAFMWACILFLCIDFLLQFRHYSRHKGLTQQRIKQIEIYASAVYFWLTYFIHCWVR